MTERDTLRSIEFRAIIDEPIGSSLAEIFGEYWPAYRRWMLKTQDSLTEDPRTQLSSFMPELVPIYERLLESFGGKDPESIGRFLTLYNPPRVVRGCSQILLDRNDSPVLLRSYDHHPALFDGLIVKSKWMERDVIAISDCLWGALDGINQDGLAVSLSFGGRNVIGPGFAAPLITRYILETCASVDEARQVLSRVPVYMPYTFLVADASGNFVTVYKGPDTQPRFVERRTSTNHQSAEDWPEYQRFTQSDDRLKELETMLHLGSHGAEAVEAFLRPPLWRSDYAHASGTLYVAEYRLAERTLSLHWPNQRVDFQLNDFQRCSFRIGL